MQALLNARVLTERGLETGLAVRLQGDTILDVVRAEPSALGNCEPIDLGGQVLAPGFIDLQVNGGGDVLFNDAPNVATLRHIASAHRRFGTTGMLPTLISSEREVLRAAIGAVRETIAAKIAGVLGIHIEGPFIAAARKGVHDPRMFRGIDATDIELMAAPGHGRTLVTLAPDRVEPTLVAQLCQRGIIVAAGHTDASYEITRTALDAGMSGFTHLFNAMSPLQGRAPGVVGAALEDRSSWCGVIVDGQHVHPAALRVHLRPSRAARSCWSPTPCRPWAAAGSTSNWMGVSLLAAMVAAQPRMACSRDRAWIWPRRCATRCACSLCRSTRPCAWHQPIPPTRWAWSAVTVGSPPDIAPIWSRWMLRSGCVRSGAGASASCTPRRSRASTEC